MEPKKTAIQNLLKQNAINMIFHVDSIVKTALITKEISNRLSPTFYFYFDLQYTGLLKPAGNKAPKNQKLLKSTYGAKS